MPENPCGRRTSVFVMKEVLECKSETVPCKKLFPKHFLAFLSVALHETYCKVLHGLLNCRFIIVTFSCSLCQ